MPYIKHENVIFLLSTQSLLVDMFGICVLVLPCLSLFCSLCDNRTDPGPEDGDSEEGGTAVLHEDVHGLSTLLHLPHEVCVCDCVTKCVCMFSFWPLDLVEVFFWYVFFFAQDILKYLA